MKGCSSIPSFFKHISMLTILNAIKLSTEYLEKKGIESARLNSELMLAEILNCKRLDLYMAFEQPMKQQEVEKLRELIARRGKNEPLQYILGKTEFFGLSFFVNNSVLIPRQETETLIEIVIEQNKSKGKIKILDIGTGSGIIPITLAKNLLQAEFVAIDSSLGAINTAKQNAEYNEVNERINFIHSDLFKTSYEESNFDIIISNPPYVSLDEYKDLQKEITHYEPEIAVTDYEDGYKFYKYIGLHSKLWLKNSGRLYLEIGIAQIEKVTSILINNGFKDVTSYKDLLNIERVVTGQKI